MLALNRCIQFQVYSHKLILNCGIFSVKCKFLSNMIKINQETSILNAADYDGIVLIAPFIAKLKNKLIKETLESQVKIDKNIVEDVSCIGIDHPAKRLIFSPTGPLNRDYDDVRRFFDAADKGIARALKAGVTSPLLAFDACNTRNEYLHGELVTLLGALKSLYVPLEIREDVPSRSSKVKKFGYVIEDSSKSSEVVKLALALEHGRIVARDIGGSDPERMAPPNVEKYVKEAFIDSTNVEINVISDLEKLEKNYPLFSAVNRCASVVKRHEGRVIELSYTGEGPIEKTLYLVGKGVTYDTGGADIKAGGVMAGMHRDKCGSAAVAGFMKIIDHLRPKHLKVIGAMAMVRNSVGSNCYVSDEIITSRAGVRVRVGNTDAEGRMAMADVLCHMKEKALNGQDPNPHLMTIATLTGHAVLALGEEYSAIMDNGPAALEKTAQNIQECGHVIADPFEISSIRRTDYDAHKGKSEYEDVLQANNLPSTRTQRGHQTPSAFLIMASGLDKHGKDSEQPLKYSHLDIAGSSGPYPGIPTGAPIVALAKTFVPSAFE